jgi:hypothetical protein
MVYPPERRAKNMTQRKHPNPNAASALFWAITRYSLAGAIVGTIGSHLENAGNVQWIDPIAWGAGAGALCWIRTLEISKLPPEISQSLGQAIGEMRANVAALIELGQGVAENQERQDLLGRELTNSVVPLVDAVKQLDLRSIQRILEQPVQSSSSERYRNIPEIPVDRKPQRIGSHGNGTSYQYDHTLLDD